MLPDLTLVEGALIFVIVIAGALTQSTVGFGFGIVIVPVLIVVAPDLLPAMPLLLSTILSIAMIRRERSDVDLHGLPPLFVGRVAGTLVAIWLLVSLTGPALEILFGTVIVLVVAVSALRPAINPTSTANFVGGAASGLFATTAGIGGPPVAVLYAGRPGPEIRSTLAAIFMIGSSMSLVALIPAGRIGWGHLVFAAILLVPTAIGFAISGPLGRFLEGRWLRPTILTFAASGGVLAVIRGLTA